MFESLVASGPQSRVGPHRYALSVSLHAALVAGAVALTRHPAAAAHARPAAPGMVYLAPQPVREPAPSTTHTMPQVRSRAPSLQPSFEAPDLALPSLPAGVPTVADLVEAASGRTYGLGAARPATAEPMTAGAVDEAVEIVEQPAPRYPPSLAQAGLGGQVELEYVVDTTGCAEPRSIRTVAATHPAFEAAARASVVASRYRPARLQGRAVRQLVRQTLTFRAGD